MTSNPKEELENTKRALAVKTNLLNTVLSSVGDSIIATDSSGHIILMNPVAIQLCGISAKEATGKIFDRVFTLKDQDDSEELKLNWETTLTQRYVTTAILATANNSECPISLTMSPIIDEADVNCGYIFILRDMTEHMNVELRMRQQQKLESLGTLTSGIAHEIKNPLTVIMNTAEILVNKFEEDEEAKKFASKIVDETSRVSKIATNMLAFARQDVFEDPMAPTSMGDIIESVLSLVRSVVAKDDIAFEVDIEDDLPKIKCRTHQIQQVLINLVTNARDALNQRYSGSSERKSLTIRCKTLTDSEGYWIRTTVEDHATGIRPTIIDRIFDPFYTTKQSGAGTGLGLSVSHSIVTKHGGRLTVESEVLKYTRFHMDLLPARISRAASTI